jgi:4-hydroxy-3-methylbut-2-en-1-yl diphosphate reductase
VDARGRGARAGHRRSKGRGYDGRVRPLVPDRTVASRVHDRTVAPRKVLLAAPRGYCAGVDRAVEAVEDALERHGPPVYVRKQIVHNLHVVRELEAKGAVFVEEETEVPQEAVVVLSAHGVAPEVYANAAERRLTVLDATCPLVTKVHLEARRFAEAGRTIVLIGHAGHEEVVGTTGQAPGKTILVQTVDDARTVEIPAAADLAYLTQTTLSVDETDAIIRVLRDRFPGIQAPPREDICYATQNRQDAVKALADRADVVLVIGSANSSNSRRLAEVVRERGVPAYLVDDETEIDLAWLEGVDVVGVTSGASAPERLVERMLAFLAKVGATDVEEVTLATERLRFSNVRV